MKILITGATGLIGTELVKLFLENGNTINYLTTSKDKIQDKPNYFGYYWNPENGNIDENSLIGVDVIVHLAGANIAKRWTNAYKKEIIESRTLSSEVLFNVLKNNPHQVKQIVSASGTAIYPESHSKIYNESDTERDDSFLANVVLKWEESVDRFQTLGLKVVKLRTGVVFAINGGALPEMVKPIKTGFGAAMGNGKQIQSWIHITDLVALYYFVVKNQLEGVFNAVSPNPISNADLTKAIAKALHKPLFMPNIPEFVIKIILGEMSILLFSSKNLSSKKIEDCGFKFKFPEIQKALNNLYQ
jgi:uncharacterized protein (TIGR01777 family)